MIYYLHVHKGGGTTFINLAKLNYEKFYKEHANGNPCKDGEIINLWDIDPDVEKELLFGKDHTFIANEQGLPEVMTYHESIKYTIVVRHPLDIILSNEHHQAHFKQEEFDPYRKEWWKKVGYYNQPNIFYLSKCGKPNWEVAMERVSNFDAVIFLERYAEDMVVMKDVAGWHRLNPDKNKKGTARNSNARKELPPEVLNPLTEYVSEDIAFYEELKAKCSKGRFVG